jgi:hypothetical protein
MNIKNKLFAFACGIAAIVTANALVAEVNLWAAAEDDAVEVCVNDQGVMRVVTSEASCAAEDRRVVLKAPEIEKSCEKERQAEVAGLRKRVADLEAKDDAGDASTVTAPFEVVNERGTIVFSVEESQGGALPALTKFFDDTGARIATIAARDGGGELTVSSIGAPAGSSGTSGLSGVEATLSTWGDYADFMVNANSNLRLELGRRRASGNYGLSTFNAGGKLAAGLGSTKDGAGIALIFDASGRSRIALQCEAANGPGLIQVFNSATLPVATLSGKGAAESGFLQLTNNVGEPMVNAEVFPTGLGAVRAGPGAFQHGIMFLPLPASYIEGKKP